MPCLVSPPPLSAEELGSGCGVLQRQDSSTFEIQDECIYLDMHFVAGFTTEA